MNTPSAEPPFDAAPFRRLVAERSGLVLTPEKDYLLKSRLEPLARELNLGGLAEVLAAVMGEPSGRIAGRAVDAMATHESSFFRDGAPFEQLRQTLLPALAASKPPGAGLRVWSAACSSGQEPYSLAMLVLEEAWRLSGRSVEIVATDLSEPILTKARSGLYTDFELRRGLSPERQARWTAPEGDARRISPDVRRMVDFRRHNLLDGTAGLGRFDLILCRNVLIYFDPERKRRTLERLADALLPDGALVLGSAETTVGIQTAFEPAPGLRGVMRLPRPAERLSA